MTSTAFPASWLSTGSASAAGRSRLAVGRSLGARGARRRQRSGQLVAGGRGPGRIRAVGRRAQALHDGAQPALGGDEALAPVVPLGGQPGGDDGLRGFSRQPLDFGLFKFDILSNADNFYFFVLFCFALAVGAMGFILRSPFGRTMEMSTLSWLPRK